MQNAHLFEGEGGGGGGRSRAQRWPVAAELNTNDLGADPCLADDDL